MVTIDQRMGGTTPLDVIINLQPEQTAAAAAGCNSSMYPPFSTFFTARLTSLGLARDLLTTVTERFGAGGGGGATTALGSGAAISGLGA